MEQDGKLLIYKVTTNQFQDRYLLANSFEALNAYQKRFKETILSFELIAETGGALPATLAGPRNLEDMRKWEEKE